MLSARDVELRRGPFLLRVPLFEAGPGQMHALVGRNGAGKSTWLLALAGMIEPCGGEIRCGGKRSAPPCVAYLPSRAEDAVLGARRSLEVELTLALRGAPAEDATRKVAELDHVLDLPPEDEQSRHELLYRALYGLLATDARVLLADEPTSRISPDGRRQFYRSLDRLRGEGYLAVVATHDPELARRADRIWRVGDATVSPSDLSSVVGEGILRPPQPGAAMQGLAPPSVDLEGALRLILRT